MFFSPWCRLSSQIPFLISTRWASERQIGCRRRNHQRHRSRFWKLEIGRSVKNDGRKEVKENIIRKKDYTLWSKSCYHNGLCLYHQTFESFFESWEFLFSAPCIGIFGKEKKFTFIVPGHTISWPNGETSSPVSLAAERWWAEEKGGTRWERRWNERKLITLRETNSSHLKKDTSFLLGWPIFRGLGLFQGVHLFFF